MPTFKTRARTLDMLGRQQIAGIPSAISELFKNAHDAYADKVDVDFFRHTDLFILRDDGLGMTEEDFETRWLVLGTESKVAATARLLPPQLDPQTPVRPVMGEKGIGRLAIAVVGPQVLILTRAKRVDGLHDLVAAFIHWGLFEIPGIDLDQIEIPVRTFPGGTLPGAADVAALVDVVRENVRRLHNFISTEQVAVLYADLDRFNVDPGRFDGRLRGPSLRRDGHGTHFYILPTNEMLVPSIDDGDTSDSASPLLKSLSGFTNTMTTYPTPPSIKTAFRDYKTVESFIDLIAEREFFTPPDFGTVDHHFEGVFDEYGQFKGDITVFGERIKDHIVSWTATRGKRTDCGPFSIKLGYVQGEANTSLLSPEDWHRMTRKLNRIGGLYIYKDGIRVLPYGDNDFDWLDIEKNRTKNVGRHFFSYRRMFGFISISHKENASLSEKAGREGFRENKAYRQFKTIMKNFFVQLAADFFRNTGVHGETYTRHKEELDRFNKVRREREKQAAVERALFEKELDRLFTRITNGEAEQEATAIIEAAGQAIKAALVERNAEQSLRVIEHLEADARRKLSDLRSSFRLNIPPGVGLTSQLRRDWNRYATEQDRLEERVFGPASSRLDQVVSELVRDTKITVDVKRRHLQALMEITNQARRRMDSERSLLQDARSSLDQHITQLLSSSQTKFERISQEAQSRLSNVSPTVGGEAAFVEERRSLEAQILAEADRQADIFSAIHRQLRQIKLEDDDDRPVQAMEVTAALEEELLILRERSEVDLELTQLGMAIEVINHEFNNTVGSIRTGLKRLSSWANRNESLKKLYEELRTNFEHLDGYLTLFTPLHRRLYRSPITFTGGDISEYLRDLFTERLRQNEVELITSESFKNAKLVGYPSTFYPVFVNLVDNALFWLRDAAPPRIIRLDTDGQAFIVSDTGPGISLRDRDTIFEFGFSRKPGGRGLGLYISRDVLSKVGYRLELASREGARGTTFRIEPVDQPQD